MKELDCMDKFMDYLNSHLWQDLAGVTAAYW